MIISGWLSIIIFMSAPRLNIAFSFFYSSLVPLARPLMFVERMLMVDFVLLCNEKGFISDFVKSGFFLLDLSIDCFFFEIFFKGVL